MMNKINDEDPEERIKRLFGGWDDESEDNSFLEPLKRKEEEKAEEEGKVAEGDMATNPNEGIEDVNLKQSEREESLCSNVINDNIEIEKEKNAIKEEKAITIEAKRKYTKKKAEKIRPDEIMDNGEVFYEFVKTMKYEVPQNSIAVKLDENCVKSIADAMNVPDKVAMNKIIKAFLIFFKLGLRKDYENGKGKIFKGWRGDLDSK